MQRPDVLVHALKKKEKKDIPSPPVGSPPPPYLFDTKRTYSFCYTWCHRPWADNPSRASVWSGSLKDGLCSRLFSRFWDPFHISFLSHSQPQKKKKKMDCGSGNVSNRPWDDCQKCNHPIGSKGKYSLKWHMLIGSNSKHVFGHADVGKCHILISWTGLGSFRSSFLILIASQVSGKFFPTTVYWSHPQSI